MRADAESSCPESRTDSWSPDGARNPWSAPTTELWAPTRLASYAGLAPVDWQSGRSAVSRKPRGGNHRLKNAMFTAAFVATQHDPDARAYYQRKRSQGKRHNAAVICVARRRCNIILAMLKTQTPYQEPQPQPLPQAA